MDETSSAGAGGAIIGHGVKRNRAKRIEGYTFTTYVGAQPVPRRMNPKQFLAGRSSLML